MSKSFDELEARFAAGYEGLEKSEIAAIYAVAKRHFSKGAGYTLKPPAPAAPVFEIVWRRLPGGPPTATLCVVARAAPKDYSVTVTNGKTRQESLRDAGEVMERIGAFKRHCTPPAP